MTMQSVWDEEDVTRRAFAAYFRYGDRHGFTMNQPANYSGVIWDEKGLAYVRLVNANGVLAIYRIRRDGSLKMLRRWPKELEADI